MNKTFIAKGLFVKAASPDSATETSLWIKGFASMAGNDRIDDNIDPRLFDLKTFMTNPQLWLDHNLVEKQMEDGSFIKTNIGLVREAYVARVDLAEDGKSFKVLNLEDDSIIDTIENMDTFIVKDGQRGLWVKAEIMEQSIADEVKAGKINSFSWQGSIERRKSGTIKKIDLVEVSIVHIPMHPQAKFMVGKGFLDNGLTSAVVYSNGRLEERNVDEVECKKSKQPTDFLALGVGSEGTVQCYFDTEESARSGALSLLASCANVAVLEAKHLKTKDGGAVYTFRMFASAGDNAALREEVENTQKAEVTESEELTTAEKVLLNNDETKSNNDETVTKGGELAMTQEEMQKLGEIVGAAVKSAMQPAGTTEQASEAQTQTPAADTEKKSDTTAQTDASASMEASFNAMGDVIKKLAEGLEALTERVNSQSSAPKKSQQLQESDSSEEEGDEEPVTTDSVLKSLASLSKEQQDEFMARFFIDESVLAQN